MRRCDVKIGGTYYANVSGKKTKVKIGEEKQDWRGQFAGWHAVNLATNREIRIRTAARLTEIPVPLAAWIVEVQMGDETKKFKVVGEDSWVARSKVEKWVEENRPAVEPDKVFTTVYDETGVIVLQKSNKGGGNIPRHSVQ